MFRAKLPNHPVKRVGGGMVGFGYAESLATGRYRNKLCYTNCVECVQINAVFDTHSPADATRLRGFFIRGADHPNTTKELYHDD